MIDRMGNKQRLMKPWNGTEAYHGAYHRVDGKLSCSSRYACHNNRTKCAESTEMAMHEKANRCDLAQRIETAT